MPLQLIQNSQRYNAACFEQREKPLSYRLSPLVTFFPMGHIRCSCRMCGNEAVIMPWQNYKGIIRFGEPDLCDSCDHVMSDYGAMYDDEDWEEEEMHGYCRGCGGEYGDGWSMCTCHEDEDEEEQQGINLI